MDRKFSTLGVAAALAGAVAMSALISTDAFAQAKGNVKCYGISAAGKNDCANAAGKHSCAGQTKAEFDGEDWKGVASKDACMQAKGKTEPFKGKNPDVKS